MFHVPATWGHVAPVSPAADESLGDPAELELQAVMKTGTNAKKRALIILSRLKDF